MSTEQELWWPKINGKEGKKAYLDLTCAAAASVAAASFHAHNITNKQYLGLCVAFIKAWPSDHPGKTRQERRTWNADSTRYRKWQFVHGAIINSIDGPRSEFTRTSRASGGGGGGLTQCWPRRIRTRTWPLLRCPPQRAIICLHNYIIRSARSFFWDQLLNPRHWAAAAHGAHLNNNVLFFTYNVSHIHTVNTTHNKSVWFFLVRTKDQLQSLL